MVFVAVTYANNYLNVQMASNEFNADKQFMLTTGLQIDNAAWTVGRTQTVQYIAKFGQVTFVPAVLSYTFEISTNNGVSYQTVLNCTTGMILFNMPVNYYNLGKNYFGRVFPTSNGSFLQWGSTAPVSQVFTTEKTPLANGTYARIVAVPTVRLLNSTLTGGSQYYFKYYLPALVAGVSPHLSQSITLIGTNVAKVNPSGAITQVRINATSLATPTNPPGFDLSFFNFDHSTEVVNIPTGTSTSLIEIYTSTVQVSVGLTS